jgi:paraquat-inducible protein B
LQIFTETVQKIIADLRKVNFQDIVENISQTTKGVNELVNSRDMRESITNFNGALQDLQKLIQSTDELVGNVNGKVESVADSFESTMDDTRELVNNIDSRVDPVAEDIEATLAAVKSSFEEAESLLVEAQKLISENSKLRQEIIFTLESMSDASRSVEELGDYLQRHPESLIKGKK